MTAVLALEACLVRRAGQRHVGHARWRPLGGHGWRGFPKVASRNAPARFALTLSDLGE